MKTPQGRYTRLSYDHYCEICGKDISNRVKSVKYCYECSAMLTKKRAEEKRELTKRLMSRDEVRKSIYLESKSSHVCAVCLRYVGEEDNFCKHCGQRLKPESN